MINHPYCIFCGIQEKVEKHHVRYQPPIVINLCSFHHGKADSIKRKMEKIKPLKVKCHSCQYEWKTKSLNPKTVSCASCGTKVNKKGGKK